MTLDLSKARSSSVNLGSVSSTTHLQDLGDFFQPHSPDLGLPQCPSLLQLLLEDLELGVSPTVFEGGLVW